MEAANATYTIQLSNFEGPLELLLDLIEKRKLLINDVSLALVTDDYLKHLKESDSLPVGETAQFVVVASTLLLIKSRSLLPVLEFTDEETASMEDLEHRLRLYQIIRNAALLLSRKYGSEPLLPGAALYSAEPLFAPADDVDVALLSEAIQRVIANLPALPEKEAEAIVQTVISLEEMIDRLSMRVSDAVRLSFQEFAGDDPAKRHEVVVGFLALLELVKEGIITVEQEGRFKDIIMETENIETPRYA